MSRFVSLSPLKNKIFPYWKYKYCTICTVLENWLKTITPSGLFSSGTLKMTSVKIVALSYQQQLEQNYTHLDDHTVRT